MTTEQTVSSIVNLRGVYGAFHCTPDVEKLTAHVPPDWTLEIAQTLAQRGIRTFNIMCEEVPDCYELRIDVEYVSILMNQVEDGFIFTLTSDPQSVGAIQDQVEFFCQQYNPTDGPSPSVVQEATVAEARSSPVPTVTMPVSVHAAQNQISRYTNEVPIGEGGTAVVYKAFDMRLNRDVALKRFKSSEETAGERCDYQAELSSASRIRHHNVLSTFDADIDDQGRFLVMELIDGNDLEKTVERAPLRDSFVDFALQALEGLNATHRAGLLHLDIKPSNIMISEGASGRLHTKLIDFGQAESFGEEASPKGAGLKGSIHYCSPEYITEQPVDQRTDIYSMGCVFYFALTGKHPFTGPTPIAVMAAHLQHQVIDIRQHFAQLPEYLASCIMSMISYDPKDRPADAEEVMKAILNRRQESSETEIEQLRSNQRRMMA